MMEMETWKDEDSQDLEIESVNVLNLISQFCIDCIGIMVIVIPYFLPWPIRSARDGSEATGQANVQHKQVALPTFNPLCQD